MRKIINGVILTVLSLFMFGSVIAQTSDQMDDNKKNEIQNSNVNVHYSSIYDEVKVGEQIKFKFNFSYTAKSTEGNNIKFEIHLPKEVQEGKIDFTQSLDELKINGVKPSLNNNKLSYELKGINASFNKQIILNLNTRNGSALDGSRITSSAHVYLNEVEVAKKDSSVKLIAVKNLAVTNKLTKVLTELGEESKEGLRISDQAVYGLGVSVNKLQSGTIGLDEQQEVIVKYIIPKDAKYISNSSGKEPSQTAVGNTNELEWKFMVSETDDSSDVYYFLKNFEVVVEVTEGNYTPFSDFETIAFVSAKYLDGKEFETEQKASNLVLPKVNEGENIPNQGTTLVPGFAGPLDEKGGVQNPNDFDEKPAEVFDNALLKWRIFGTTFSASNPVKKLNSYDLFYHPDKNLNVNKINIGAFSYRPNTSISHKPLDMDVFVSLSVLYEGENNWTFLQSGLQEKTSYDLRDLGLDDYKTVESVWIHFYSTDENKIPTMIGINEALTQSKGTIPAGFNVRTLDFETSVKPGFVGKIVSGMGISVSGYNNNNTSHNPDSDSVNMFYNLPRNIKRNDNMVPWPDNALLRFVRDKSVNVITPSEGESRVVQSVVKFKNSQNSVINSGSNDVVVDITNDEASLNSLEAPFYGYLVLPQGVKIDETKAVKGASYSVIDSDYRQTGKTLVRIDFNTNTSLALGKTASMSLPVVVSDDIAYLIDLEFNGYLNKDFIVSDISENSNHFITKDKDTHDYNENGNTDESIYRTRSLYSNHQNILFKGNHKVKELTSIEFKDVAYHYDNDDIASILKIKNEKNTAIKDLTLISMLPSKADKFYISNLERNSELDYYLTEQIILNPEYSDLFDIYYTVETENLETDAVWQNFEEISDVKEIKGFKIVKKKDTKSLYLNELTIEYLINTDSVATNEAKVAYGSFMMKVNDLEMIETLPSKIIRKTKDILPPTGLSNTHMIVGMSAIGLGLLILIASRKRYSK